MVADALGLELDEIREVHEFAGVDIDVDVEIGRIAAGTVAAIRFEVQGDRRRRAGGRRGARHPDPRRRGAGLAAVRAAVTTATAC